YAKTPHVRNGSGALRAIARSSAPWRQSSGYVQRRWIQSPAKNQSVRDDVTPAPITIAASRVQFTAASLFGAHCTCTRLPRTQCATFYAETMGRPSLPPGIYFRLLLIGYFEGIDSER